MKRRSDFKIIYVVLCAIILILCFIAIRNIRITDNSNRQVLEQIVTFSGDSLVELEFTYDEYFLINYIEINLPYSLGDNAELDYEIVNEKGYYIDRGDRFLADFLVDGQGIISLENKLDKGNKYILKMGLTESGIQEVNAKIVIEFIGYKNLSGIYQVILFTMCVIIAVVVLAIVSKNILYVKLQECISMVLMSCKSPTFVEYLIIAVFFLILLMSNMYGDTKAFVHYEVNFWRSIFQEGGLQNFYEYSYKMEQYYKANGIGGAYAAYYDFPMFMLFGIWGFPLYLICEGLGIEETSNMWTMVYGKAIFIVATVVAAYMIYKICQNIKINKTQSKWAMFLFVSSILVLVDVAYIGQLDIMGITFTLLGIYYYQKNCRWKFTLFFMIAVTFKQFPFFIFIPLLLLIEKNVIKIGLQAVVVLFFSKLTGLPFPSDTMAITAKNEFSEQSLQVLLGVKAPLYNEAVPIIVLLLGAICIYCYLKKIQSQKELEQYSIFISFLAMFVLLISFDSNPYWYIQIAPFVVIMLMYNSKQYNNLILFETVGMICLILNQFGANYWCFEPVRGEGMLMTLLFGKPEGYLSMERFIAYTKLNQFSGVFFAGFVLCMGTVLWLSRPGKIAQDEKIIIRPYALLRMLANVAVAYVPVLLYVVSALFL